MNVRPRGFQLLAFPPAFARLCCISRVLAQLLVSFCDINFTLLRILAIVNAAEQLYVYTFVSNSHAITALDDLAPGCR